MSRTRPTTEQVRFRSAATGEHILDTYMEAAEVGGRTLSDLVQDVWQPNGVIRQDLVEWRLRNGSLQTRVGDYADPNAGWRDVSKFFSHRGNFAPGTLYENYETVTVADGSLHVVNNLTVPTSYASEAAFKAVHTRLINTQVLDNYIIQAEAAQTGAIAARTAAETARTQAQTAQAAAEAARNLSQTYRNEAQTHRTNAELAMAGANTARDAAQTARTGAETAQGLAETARNAAQTAQGAATAAQTYAQTARTGAETARNTAIAARDTTVQARDEVNGLLGDVVSTSTAQSITGLKTFAGGLQIGNGNLDVRAASGTNKHVWFRDADGTNKALVYHEAAGDKLSLAKYPTSGGSSHVARLEILNTGAIHAAAGFFSGPASGLTGMNASELTTGTIPAARMPATVVQTQSNSTINGDVTVNRLRIVADNDASTTSTAHGLQIGPSTGTNLIIDNNEIITRVNGVGASTFFEYGIHTSSAGDGFKGKGTLLEDLNASELTTGTVPNARLTGSYSFTDLTLTGRLKQGQTNTWGTGGLEIAGSTPNIWFNQTDATMSAMAGVNGNSFYIVNDTNSSGAYDAIAWEVPLNDTDAKYFGRALAYQQITLSGGNGMVSSIGNLSANRTITLGTPSAITEATTNSVTATSHTHALGSLAVRRLAAEGGYNGVGAVCLMGRDPNAAQINPGTVVAGSTLRYAGITTFGSSLDRVRTTLGAVATGTWECMGVLPVTEGGSGDGGRGVATVFMKVT